MSFELEIAELKKQYFAKREAFKQDKKPSTFRDANGNEEHKIDLWFLSEINKLKKKYNID